MKFLRMMALALAAVLLLGMLPGPATEAAAELSQQYWIGVDVANQRVTIYRTADNSVVHRWRCSTGAPATPTPLGTYHLPTGRNTDRKEWYHFGNCYVKWAVRITGGIYFHSILFNKRADNTIIQSSVDKLGNKASHGCIRLEIAHAKWISDNVANGTLVVIHKGVNDSRITKVLGGSAGTSVTPSLPAPPTVKVLALDQSGTVTLQKGQTLQLNCAIQPADATTVLTWKSSKTKYATVSNTGLVTAVGHGTATITVKASNGVSTSVKVTSVDNTVPTKVSLDRAGTVVMNLGDTLQLNAALAPETAVSALTWKSSKAKVATVSAAGLVTANAVGTAKITVQTANKKKASVTVKVVNPYAPTKVNIAEGSVVTLKEGQTLQLNGVLTPNTAVSTLTWSSSKKKVATVSATGMVTALKKGTARITVKTDNGKRARITIKVVK